MVDNGVDVNENVNVNVNINKEVSNSPKTREDIIYEVKNLILKNESTNLQLTTLIISVTALFPSMGIMGFMGKSMGEFIIEEIGLSTLFLISGFGGAIGLALMHPNPNYRMLGIFPGFILGFGVFIASVLYLLFRQHILIIEIIIPLLIGALPGYLLYYFLVKRKTLKDAGF